MRMANVMRTTALTQSVFSVLVLVRCGSCLMLHLTQRPAKHSASKQNENSSCTLSTREGQCALGSRVLFSRVRLQPELHFPPSRHQRVSLSPLPSPLPRPCVLSPDFTESTGPESGSAASLAAVRLLRRSPLPRLDQQLRPVLADLVDRQLHLALDLEVARIETGK